MRDLLDQRGFWLVYSANGGSLGQTGPAPVATDDALTVFRGQGPIVVSVLDNDTDPDGGPLALISVSAALGTATANGDGTVTYAAPQGTPPGVVQFDTVIYEIADQDDNRDTGQIDITITEPALSVDITPENKLTVTAAPDPIDITVTTPTEFAGTYSVDPLDLLAGPVDLSSPSAEGLAEVGQILTVRDGLWLHDLAAEALAQSWQWQRSGVDIVGATGSAYQVQAMDIGEMLTAAETRTDAYGGRTAVSQPVQIGFQPSDDPALIGWWDAADLATITADVNNNVSAWEDKAGGEPLVTSFGTSEPTNGARSLNGRNMLDFDGGDFLEGAITLPALGDVAFHMVVDIDSTTSAFEALLSVEATNDFQVDANSDTAFDGRLNLAGVGSPVDLTGGPFTGAFILSVVFDQTGSGTVEVFVSDVSRRATAYTTPLDAAAALHIMTNRSKNAWVNGAVGEVIVTGTVSNRADHHAYLETKWGLV